jgi:hypothetical protein
MAIKTFTSGAVLTASDTNTYLANSGLVYIKEQTIGNGVGSVTVSNAFSATYDNYVININVTTSSASVGAIRLSLDGSADEYYAALVYGSYTGGSPLLASLNDQAQWNWVGGLYGSNGAIGQFTLMSPFLSKYTRVYSQAYEGSSNAGALSGIHKVASSYTAFIFSPESGTLTGGTVTVYGYRKA